MKHPRAFKPVQGQHVLREAVFALPVKIFHIITVTIYTYLTFTFLPNYETIY